jgi:hypothetical protein
VDIGQVGLREDAAALHVVRAVQADDERTVGSMVAKASMSPLATSSQRVIPPKMLNSTALTFGLERMTSTAR